MDIWGCYIVDVVSIRHSTPGKLQLIRNTNTLITTVKYKYLSEEVAAQLTTTL